MIVEESRDGRWRIVEEVRDRDSYVELHRTTTWSVVHVPSGDTVEIICSTDWETASARSAPGVRSVRFGPDGSCVIVEGGDGRERRVPLEWPVPPGPLPDGQIWPEGMHEWQREEEEEYRRKLAERDEIEARWRAARERSAAPAAAPAPAPATEARRPRRARAAKPARGGAAARTRKKRGK